MFWGKYTNTMSNIDAKQALQLLVAKVNRKLINNFFTQEYPRDCSVYGVYIVWVTNVLNIK